VRNWESVVLIGGVVVELKRQPGGMTAQDLKLAKLEGQGTVFMVYPVMTVEAGGDRH